MRQLLRIFSADKNVESPLLNRLGVQPLRTMAARVFYNASPSHATPEIANAIKRLNEDGYAILTDFLPSDEFQKLEKEALAFIKSGHPSIKPRVDGPNTFAPARIDEAGPAAVPEATKFANNPTVRALLEAAVKTKLGDLYAQFEHLIQGMHPGNLDPQAVTHSDYFANTYKAFFFITDVEREHGPFAFVKGSQKITPGRLGWVYKESCKENSGSRRITDEEIKDSGLTETVVTCKKNTLVLVNTHGFHRRLMGTKGKERLSIAFSARVNPFLLRF